MPVQDVYYYLKVLKQADVLLRRAQDTFYLLLKNWKSTSVFFLQNTTSVVLSAIGTQFVIIGSGAVVEPHPHWAAAVQNR